MGMKIVVMVLLASVILSAATAQNKTANSLTYKSAVGVRIWNGAGISVKTFFQEKNAIELNGFFYKGGTRLTGFFEHYGDLSTEGNLKWYGGFGAGVTFITGSSTFHVSGIGGVDYKFNNLPLNISIDWTPSVELGGGTYFEGNRFGVGVRYTL
jgi:hypothetical protein